MRRVPPGHPVQVTEAEYWAALNAAYLRAVRDRNRRELREARARARCRHFYGMPDAICVFCGQSDPRRAVAK